MIRLQIFRPGPDGDLGVEQNREKEGTPVPGQLPWRPEPGIPNSSCSPVCPALPSEAPAPSATPGSSERKETGSSHRACSSGLCGPNLKLAKTSLVARMWEGQAQSSRARVGKAMTEEVDTLLGKRFWEKKMVKWNVVWHRN